VKAEGREGVEPISITVAVGRAGAHCEMSLPARRCFVSTRYADPVKRAASLRHFPPQYAARLRDAGFFAYGKSKTLTCFCCGLILVDIPDDPFFEHIRQNPACAHTGSIKSVNYRNHVIENYGQPKYPWESKHVRREPQRR